ncbi:MAG: hypothetical protein IS860_00345 [Nitrosopumilus sp.]|nr:hypothetical protein [Nitrosopumilus sp.]
MKKLALFVIFTLLSFSTFNAYGMEFNFKDLQSDDQLSTIHHVVLHESLSAKMITDELNELPNSYNIVLTEKLSVVDSDDFEQLLILKTTADKHATLERIFDRNNIYKISDNKNSKFNNYILNNEIDSNYKFDLYFEFGNLNYLILNLETYLKIITNKI